MDPNWIRVREHNVSFDDLLDKRHLLDLAEVTRDKLVKVHASTDRFTHVVPAIPYNPLVGGRLIFIDQGAYLLSGLRDRVFDRRAGGAKGRRGIDRRYHRDGSQRKDGTGIVGSKIDRHFESCHHAGGINFIEDRAGFSHTIKITVGRDSEVYLFVRHTGDADNIFGVVAGHLSSIGGDRTVVRKIRRIPRDDLVCVVHVCAIRLHVVGGGGDVGTGKLGRRHICDFGRDEIRTRIDDTVDVGKDGGVGGSDNQGEFVPVVGDGRRRLCRHIGHRYQRDHKQEYQDDAEKKDEFSHFEPPFLSRKKLWSLETTVSAFAATAEILLWRLRPP